MANKPRCRTTVPKLGINVALLIFASCCCTSVFFLVSVLYLFSTKVYLGEATTHFLAPGGKKSFTFAALNSKMKCFCSYLIWLICFFPHSHHHFEPHFFQRGQYPSWKGNNVSARRWPGKTLEALSPAPIGPSQCASRRCSHGNRFICVG